MNEEIIKEAMTPQLVKLLQKFVAPLAKTQTGKLLSTARQAYKSKGFQEALSVLEKEKGLLHNIKKMKPGKFYRPVVKPKTGTGAGRFVRRGIGNLASTTKILTKGVAEAGWHAPIKASENLLRLMGRNVRSTQYKLVPVSKAKKYKTRKGGSEYYGRFFKKKIVGKTRTIPGQEEYILRKSPIGRLVGAGFSAPAFGLYTYQSTKGKKPSARVSAGIGEAAAWTVAPGATMAGSILYDYLKSKKKVSGG